MPTGLVEVYVREIEVLGPAGDLPMPVFGDQPYPEDTRLKYRFLDLRREKLHGNIMLRGRIIDSLRARNESMIAPRNMMLLCRCSRRRSRKRYLSRVSSG